MIVFFDEMDSLFRTRGSGVSSDVENTIVPQLLSEIDGVEGLENVIVIGASNREDMIDPAILRPGRLDVKIKIERPDAEAAQDIFTKYLTADLPLHADDLPEFAGNRDECVAAMIQRTVERMYTETEENRFLEVTYANGDKEILYFKDFNSGAMIQNIVDRAKKMAIKDSSTPASKGFASSICCRPASTSSRRTRTCRTRRTPTTGPASPARRASGSSSSARSSPASRAPSQAVRSTTSPTPASTSEPSASDLRRHGCPDPAQRRLGPMTVRRIMGTETEFGVSVLGTPSPTRCSPPPRSSTAYASRTARTRRARWDFEEESPLRDARGFDLTRSAADASQLTDEDVGLANLILTNGARLYVDHAHPEYSTPECTNPLDVVRWDKAGEMVIMLAARNVDIPGQNPIVLYKNNTDNKGASYGSHENYLMRRSTPFADIVRHLTPFFVTRQVVCGAGRVGLGQDGKGHGFQISQRADFFEVEVGLETTLKRPIINTRDEPHADPEKYRRLHVIIGDANLSEISTYLKVGTTSLVLAMIEDRVLTSDLSVEGAVAQLHEVSHDPPLKHLVPLRTAGG